MICRFRKLEPSLSSIKEKSLESRRVRTQPCTNMGAMGAVRFNASLTDVGDSMAEGGRSDRHTQATAMQPRSGRQRCDCQPKKWRAPRCLARYSRTAAGHSRSVLMKGGLTHAALKCEMWLRIYLLANHKHTIHNRRCEVIIESSVYRCLLAGLFLLHHRLWRQCP